MTEQKFYRIYLSRCIIALLSGLLLNPFLCFSQTDTTKKLKEVTISSDRAPKNQTITPSQQISSIDFDRYGAFTVADAIRDFAGVNIKDYGGIGGLKTVSVRSLGANHLAVLYDGVELNDAENGQVDLGKLNLNNVAQIVLYNGQPPKILQPAQSFASASVLSIITVRPQLTAIKPYQITAGIKGGSFGLVNPYLQWQQRIIDHWSFVINSYLEHADGRYKYLVNGDGSDSSYTRNNAGISTQQVDGALYWARNDSNKFDLHINYYNANQGLPGAVIFYNPFSDQHLYSQDIFLQAGYEHTWLTGIQLLLNTKLAKDYTRYTDPDYLNGQGGLDQRYTQLEFYQSVALAYSLTSNWKIAFNNDISLNDLGTNLYNYAYPARLTLLNVLATTYVVGNWRFEGNLLHTNVDESVKTGNAAAPVKKLSPTVMATYKPFHSNEFQLRAFYKDIFRVPTFDEQYYYAVTNSRNIKPESARQLDLGATYSKNLDVFFEYLSITTDTYYNKVSDKIIALPNKNPEISSILNLGKVDIKGIDLSLKTQAKIAGNYKVVFSGTYTYQQALDVTDPASSVYNSQIPYTPQNTFAINAGIRNKQIGFYYNQVFSSSRYYLGENLPENYLNGYDVSDASLVYNCLVKNNPLVVSALVDNLFNTNYSIVRSFPMPGRSMRLSVQITI